MNITDLKISNESLGRKLWLVDVLPVYEYKNNERTDKVCGYKYTVVMPEKNFDRIGIKVEGRKLLDKPDGYAEVVFDGLELFIYWMNSQPHVGARATGVVLANQAASHKS